MANHYYDQTGVLILTTATPVIKALFDKFELDTKYPGNGQAYIARISERNSASWQDVNKGLSNLITILGLETEPGDNEVGEIRSQPNQLKALAKHYNVAEDIIMPIIEFMSKVEEHDDADLELLFRLAQLFDDGHGLRAIKMEGAFHCSKPSLFEFGGTAILIGKEYQYESGTSPVIEMGSIINDALASNNMHTAINRLQIEIQYLLNGVIDPDKRKQLTEAVRSMEFTL